MRRRHIVFAVAIVTAACSSGSSSGADGGLGAVGPSGDNGVPSGSGSCATPYRGSCDVPRKLHCTDVRGAEERVVPIYASNCKDNGGSWTTTPCLRGAIGGCMVPRRTDDCAIVWGPYNKQPDDPPATPASLEADCAKLSGVFVPPL